jgi:hypothetical protein
MVHKLAIDEGGRNLIKKLLVLAVMLVLATMMAVPTFAQLLPEDQTSVPAAVPSDGSTSTSDGATPTDGSASGALPSDSTVNCPSATNPLVVDSMQQLLELLPGLVQNCLDAPADPATTQPATTEPATAEPASVETAPAEPTTMDTVPTV